MRKTIGIEDARRLLLSREEVLAHGNTERDLGAAVAQRALVRVRRGWYVDGAEWDRLWDEGRHLLEVVAVHRESSGGGATFCLASAAALHGLPLYRLRSTPVHALLGPTSHSRVRGGVARHQLHLCEGDVTVVEGIRCTSLERTALDLAARLTPEAGISVVDAALRRAAVHGHVQDPDAAAAWREDLGRRARLSSTRGIRQARTLIALSDGRAQLPGESVSRLHLHRLGFNDVELQARVIGPGGHEYWLDFAFLGSRAFGEFDGRGKYLDPVLRGTKSTEAVVLAEKRREDEIRGVSGWAVVRWGYEHIRTPEALGDRLAAFGIRPGRRRLLR